MATPRHLLVDSKNSGIYHCVSRCTRDWLVGNRKKRCDREEDVKTRLMFLSRVFALDVLGFAAMKNHLHLVLRTHPERAEAWSSVDVVRRWALLHPASVITWALPIALGDLRPDKDSRDLENRHLDLDEAVKLVATDEFRVRDLRRQLSCLSKFHQVLKYRIARKANEEDGTRGHFWEARFRSIRVLTPTGLLAVMAYVDLNPIHAGAAATPEESRLVSIRDRIDVKRWAGSADVTPPRHSDAIRRLVRGEAGPPRRPVSKDGDREVWLAPIDCHRYEDGILPMSLDEYLRFVDSVGRLSRSDKPGRIASELPAIGDRLTCDRREVLGIIAVLHLRESIGTAIGDSHALQNEATRRGVTRIIGIRPELN